MHLNIYSNMLNFVIKTGKTLIYLEYKALYLAADTRASFNLFA